MTRLLAVLALVLLAACGGAPTPATTTTVSIVRPVRPAWPADPTRLFPSDTYLMARIDVHAAQRSPHWDAIAPLILRAAGRDSDRELLRALATKADLVLFAAAPAIGANDERFTLLLEGTGLDEDIIAAVTEGAPTAATTVRGVEVIAANHVAAVHLDARHWAIVQDTELATLLDAAMVVGPGPTDARLRAIAERVGFGQATGAVATRMTEGLRQQAQQVPIDAARGVADAQYGGLRIDLVGGARVAGTADMASPEAAAALASALTQELEAQSHGILATMLGLGAILARATVRPTGTRVDGQVSVTDEELVSLLGRLGGAMQMMGGGQ